MSLSVPHPISVWLKESRRPSRRRAPSSGLDGGTASSPSSSSPRLAVAQLIGGAAVYRRTPAESRASPPAAQSTSWHECSRFGRDRPGQAPTRRPDRHLLLRPRTVSPSAPSRQTPDGRYSPALPLSETPFGSVHHAVARYRHRRRNYPP